MQKSTNYGLNMPDRNDQYNIDHFNQNTEAIDAMLRENSVNTGKNANDISAVAEALEAHGARRDNPHEVTKAQVGLGNVENVSTNNQAPTFTEAESLTNIESGETLSVLFGKVRKLFSTLTGSAATSPVCPFPKGSPYVQYPTFPAPGELYPGTTWEVVDYGGAFFRAEGGNAAAFIAAGEKLKMQGEEIGSHRHNLSNATIKGTTGSMNRNQNHSHIFFANEYGGGGKQVPVLPGGRRLAFALRQPLVEPGRMRGGGQHGPRARVLGHNQREHELLRRERDKTRQLHHAHMETDGLRKSPARNGRARGYPENRRPFFYFAVVL